MAGEISGDNLGTPLIRELKARTDATFAGVGGAGMCEAGMTSWYDIERLTVNGLPFGRVPDLLGILRDLRSRFLTDPPDVFVGIDYNFFNLLLEGMLRRSGIPTVHYVSPTVWAWRAGRLRQIKRNVDMMLTLYPFEAPIYEAHGIGVEFVGHPRADQIGLETGMTGRGAARARLGLPDDATVLAVLPGSRGREVRLSGPDFFEAADRLRSRFPKLLVAVPGANADRTRQIESLLADSFPNLEARVFDGDAETVMLAANGVLVNSGTATLEAMLLRRPMVMSYRLPGFTYAVVSRLVKTNRFALPNILAECELVPEFIQDDATPENLAGALETMLLNPDSTALMEAFDGIHRRLRRDAGARAAEAVMRAAGASSGGDARA